MEAPILAHSPWHEGEIALQKKLGVETRMDEVGRRVMRDHLIDQHREFYPLLPMVVLGSVDRDGDAWATLRAGEPGFLHAPDEKRLTVELPREPTDPAEAGMEDGAPLALLGIDLGTRRRNRLNGTLKRHAGGFDLGVDQSFGNCPKYIQLRQVHFLRDPSEPPAGLTFPDFSTGGLLQMTGEAELLTEAPDGVPPDGAERYWRFRPRRIVWRADALPIRYDLKSS
ncbi:pyridoxamine 5'-phosphate oxidase family protein [Sinorhizobium meliloti]|uniref:Flavin-nucleotide-binding protein n=1 Tax=Rhizobium meliloti TaxID=382 RepID=A0AAW9TS84_RHIML|nr:pyridoxamine 5'-phosphate oxidase family protein [Sinorhizobium meliloti]MQW34567.1 hypothetical protein [Sinorhizobium meliloti]